MKLNLETKNILVVEDHAIIREAIKHMLHGLDAPHIFDVASGAAAISAMKNRSFDIVICDYHLGSGKNGQQLLEEARFSNLLPFDAIFIMITIEQQQSLVLTALDNKPDEYLTKPFNGQQLLARLQRSHSRKHFLNAIKQQIALGNLFLAIDHCDRLLNEGNKQMRPHLLKTRAELALDTGHLDDAQAIYQNVLKERDLPWARLGLGIIAFKHGHYEQAIAYFQQLIELHPSALEAYDWLTKTYEYSNDIELALTTLETACGLSPQAILRQQKLAALATKSKKIDIALRAYKAAIKLGKNSIHKSAKDLSGLAKIYLHNNATSQAQQLIDDLRQQFSQELEAELDAALLSNTLYQKTGQQTLAKQAFELALDLSQQPGRLRSKELRIDMVKSCFANHDIGAAKNILRDLVKSNIENKFIIEDLKQLCNAFHCEGYFDVLLEETKQELVNINNTGVRLFKQGKLKEAIASFEEASGILPENKTIALNLAKILVHELKLSGVTEAKLNKAQSYINTAVDLGIPHAKISHLHTEIAKLHHDFLKRRSQ